MNQREAYETAMELLRDHGLILSGAAGVVVAMHPDTQRFEGLHCKCQYMAGLGPFPGRQGSPDAMCKCYREGAGACVQGCAAFINNEHQETLDTVND